MISDENLRQLRALVMDCLNQAVKPVIQGIEPLVARILAEHGLVKKKVLKNKAAADRMRTYRERKRNALHNTKRNGLHSAERNALRNGERNALVEEHRQEAVDVLAFLNAETHHKFPPVETNLEVIAARLKEGYTAVQLRQIVVRKNREWGSDPKMSPFLRPKTIFGKTNAGNYAGDLVVPND